VKSLALIERKSKAYYYALSFDHVAEALMHKNAKHFGWDTAGNDNCACQASVHAFRTEADGNLCRILLGLLSWFEAADICGVKQYPDTRSGGVKIGRLRWHWHQECQGCEHGKFVSVHDVVSPLRQRRMRSAAVIGRL
jgi:hypothetical protein